MNLPICNILLFLLLSISSAQEDEGLFNASKVIEGNGTINNDTNSSSLVPTPSPAPTVPAPTLAPTAHTYAVTQEYQILFTSDQISYAPILESSSGNSSTAAFDFSFRGRFEQYMSILSLDIIERGWVTSSVGFSDFKSDSTLLDFQVSFASNETTEYALTYSMLYLSNEVDISTFPNFHLSLLEFASEQQSLAGQLNTWFNVSDIAITGVSKHGPTEPPSLKPTESPTLQPTSTPQPTPLEPFRASASYELRFETYVVEGEEPQEQFYNGSVICAILGLTSEFMSASLGQDPSRIQVRCQTSAPEAFEVTEEFDILNRQLLKSLIPADESEEGEEDDNVGVSILQRQERPGGLRRRRRLQEIHSNDTDVVRNNATTLPPVVHTWDVRFDIRMEWTSFYENASDYPDQFGGFVRSNDLDLDEVGEMLGLPELDHRLNSVRFSKRQEGLPTVAPQAPPTMAPTIVATEFRDTTNTLAPSDVTVPEVGAAQEVETAKEDGNKDDEPSTVVSIIVVVIVLLVIFGGGASVWLYIKKMEAKLEHAKKEQAKLAQAMMQAQADGTLRAPDPIPLLTEGENTKPGQQPKPDKEGALVAWSPFGTGTTQASLGGSEVTVPSDNAHHTTTQSAPLEVNNNAKLAALGAPQHNSVPVLPVPSNLDSPPPTMHPSPESPSTRVYRNEGMGILAESINPTDLARLGFASMSVHDLDNGESIRALERNQEQLYSAQSLPSLPDVQEDPLLPEQVQEDPLLAGLDEFDDYKDQNLEKMRENVERQVSGLGGMISQAMTMALIDHTENEQLPDDEGLSGVEIEANTLWQVTDWLRRNKHADHYEKENYMQDLLNKMVKCVHQGLMPPEDASRTIHGSAALLGLALANELPSHTYILTGMLKKTTAADIAKTLGAEFGAVEDAAVAGGNKGFGIVRFRHPSAAARALEQFRTSEVVVNDVAIQLAPLK